MKTKLILLLILSLSGLMAQQEADTGFQFQVDKPAYTLGSGTVIQVDAGHNNFHTSDGRYAPFAALLHQDGYIVQGAEALVTRAKLQACKIFVISNPLHSSNIGQWNLPNPSAFNTKEIRALNAWVKAGGRLLLIADHMPFAGAAAELAKSFGFEYLNCFAMDKQKRQVAQFYKGNQTLLDNEITAGIDTIVTFTGSAFKIPKGATGLLTLKGFKLLSPEVAWQFEENTPSVDGADYFQGAFMPYGKGKIVVMGEAAMFSAQLSGPNKLPVGMNSPNAPENAQLLLNIIHWLDN